MDISLGCFQNKYFSPAGFNESDMWLFIFQRRAQVYQPV
jgi:hypothetical protein